MQPNYSQNEIINFVKKLRISKLSDLGTESWWKQQSVQQKLSQQAYMEIDKNLEERVKNCFIQEGKIPLLVHESICISIWKEEIFPLIEVAIEHEPSKNFLIYMLLYHEVTAISLLETMLYHSDACKELGDSSVDLVDYCAAAITLLLSNNENQDASPARNYINDLSFGIGIRCITLVQYLAEHIESLPLSAVARFYKTHDFPMLLAHLIDVAPWVKQDGNMHKQFVDGQWFDADENAPITKSEANTWLALHQLLLFPELGKYYNMTEFAKGQLTKLNGKITNSLLEQLPPLNQLKQGIVKLSTFQLPEQKPPLILEIIPEIRHSLLREGIKGWGKIAGRQTALLINCSAEDAAKIAERMCDSLNYTTNDTHHCSHCHRTAKSRCSRCKKVWYCSRKCQVQHFSSHKTNCTAQ